MTLALLLLQIFASAQAVTLRSACLEFAAGDRETAKKCISHGESFELNGEFVSAATKYSADPEVRMKVLKSGANSEILKLCQATGWAPDHQITCMRSYPTEELIKACRKMSRDEEEQLRCVRVGREPTQVIGCISFSRELESRFTCLENDMPVAEARRCARASKNEKARLACMDEFVAKREGTWNAGRAIASDPLESTDLK
jgi:hypothetical protein